MGFVKVFTMTEMPRSGFYVFGQYRYFFALYVSSYSFFDLRMKPRFEPRRSRPSVQSFVAFERIEPAFPFAWHYHPEWELTWIEAGAGSRIVGDSIEAYEPNDLVLLCGGLPHTWSSEKPEHHPRAHRAVVVQFPHDLLASSLIARPEFHAIGDLFARAGRGLAFSAQTAQAVAAALLDLTKANGLDAWCRLASLLDRLARAPDTRPLTSASYTPSAGHGARRRFERALAFIDAQADNDALYLTQVARAVHLTPAAFSRFFQRMAGVSFVDHVNALRIGRAARLLAESDRGVAEIAFACGFGNLANFNRRFREQKGMSPRTFRAHYV
jgi:AraC-like DNA-binding protein